MRDTVHAADIDRRAEADEGVGVRVQFGAGHEILVASDSGDLTPVDRVGHHLAVQVDRERPIDGHQTWRSG